MCVNSPPRFPPLHFAPSSFLRDVQVYILCKVQLGLTSNENCLSREASCRDVESLSLTIFSKGTKGGGRAEGGNEEWEVVVTFLYKN